MMQEMNSLKNIAIVNRNPDWFFNQRIDFDEDGLKEHVQCFTEASGLLNYLRELKQKKKKEEFPDYILVDMQLPDMKASRFLESFENLVDDEESPEVFILSSSANKKNRDLAMQYPFVSAYLEKPVPADLIEVLIGKTSVD